MPDFTKQPETAPAPESILSQEEIDALLAAVKEEKETAEQKPRVEAVPKETPGHSTGQAPPASHIISIEERVAAPQTKSERLRAIENVLAEGLGEIYSGLDPHTQRLVKSEGEKTASQIELLIEHGKAAAKKILHLIRLWLQKIPGVNRFFLEQESKIKTDKIIAMRREHVD